MSGRIDPNRALLPLTMSARLLNALCEHARETHPEECCGLLVGGAPGEFAWAERCRNEMTRLHLRDPRSHPRDGRHNGGQPGNPRSAAGSPHGRVRVSCQWLPS